MELQLMQLRKKAGYKNRDDFADKISVNRRTYKSWESGEVNMNFPQACMVADALNCSLDELAGRSAPNKLTDPYEHELIENYRASNPQLSATYFPYFSIVFPVQVLFLAHPQICDFVLKTGEILVNSAKFRLLW